jgi:hypothetical protein
MRKTKLNFRPRFRSKDPYLADRVVQAYEAASFIERTSAGSGTNSMNSTLIKKIEIVNGGAE